MRITDEYIYTTAQDNLSSGYANVATLQSEVSTGIRVNNAGVDPVAMNQITQLQAHIDAIAQAAKSAVFAQSELGVEQTQLNQFSTAIQSIITTVQRIGNGTSSAEDIKGAATQISQYLQEIVSIANAKNPDGKSIFGGSNVSQDAYTITKDAQGEITGATYQGNDTQQTIPLDSGVTLNVYQSGNTVFGSGANSIFSTAVSLINQLKTGVFTADQATTALSTFKDFQTNNTNTLTKANYQSSLASFEVNIFSALKQNYTQMLGGLRDADYTSVITQLEQQKTMLQATMSANLQLEKLNLFDRG